MNNFINTLPNIIFWISTSIFIVAIVLIFGLLFRSNYHQGFKQDPLHKKSKMDLLWNIIPVLIFLALAIPAVKVFLKSGHKGNTDEKYIANIHYK